MELKKFVASCHLIFSNLTAGKSSDKNYREMYLIFQRAEALRVMKANPAPFFLSFFFAFHLEILY